MFSLFLISILIYFWFPKEQQFLKKQTNKQTKKRSLCAEHFNNPNFQRILFQYQQPFVEWKCSMDVKVSSLTIIANKEPLFKSICPSHSFFNSRIYPRLFCFRPVEQKIYFEDCFNCFCPFIHTSIEWTLRVFFLNIFFCVSHEKRKSYWFGTIWGWVNYDRIWDFWMKFSHSLLP